jgi:hypothetical protein
VDRLSIKPYRSDTTRLLRNEVDVSSAQPRGSRIKLILACGLRMVLITPIIVSPAGYSQTIPACKLPENALSISQPGAPQTPAEVHVDSFGLQAKSVDGVLHLDLRNDGPTELNQLCASTHLGDSSDTSKDVSIALALPNTGKPTPGFDRSKSCSTLPTAWQAAQSMSFDLYFRTSSDSIPLSGFLLLDSHRKAKETSTAQGSGPKRERAAHPGNAEASQSSGDCVSHAKPLMRSFILLPSKNPCWLGLPLYGALVAGGLYLVTSALWLRKWLDKSMGGPQWGFGTSFATNFTVGTGLLSLILGGSVITDALHYLTKTHYLLLSLVFAALLLIAPALFTFFSKQQKFPSSSGPPVVAAVGWVWLYILTSTLMLGAVVGQLITVGLVMAEVQYRGYLPGWFLAFVVVLLVTACIGTVKCAANVVPSYLNQQREAESLQVVSHLEALKEHVVSVQGRVTEFAPGSETFGTGTQEVLNHLIEREKEIAPNWKMF